MAWEPLLCLSWGTSRSASWQEPRAGSAWVSWALTVPSCQAARVPSRGQGSAVLCPKPCVVPQPRGPAPDPATSLTGDGRCGVAAGPGQPALASLPDGSVRLGAAS